MFWAPDSRQLGFFARSTLKTSGDRFVVSTAAEAAVPITVLLNWQGLFEK